MSESLPRIEIAPAADPGPVESAPAAKGGSFWTVASWIFLLMVGAGSGFWLAKASPWEADTREALPEENPSLLNKPAGIVVTAEPVTERSLKRVIEAVGTLHGFEEVVISAKVDGRVLRVHHEVADRVKPNEVLVELDPTDLELVVKQSRGDLQVERAKLGLNGPPGPSFELASVPAVVLAQLRVEQAKIKMDRMLRLGSQKAVSDDDVENAVNEFRTAEANRANQLLIAESGLAMVESRQSALAIAEQKLSDTVIRTPTPHVAVLPGDKPVTYLLTERSVAEGSFLRVGDRICKVAIDSTLKLRVPIPERYTNDVRVGQSVDVHVAAFPAPFPGTVTLIHPSVDPATRTFQVEIQVENPDSRLKAGSFAKAIIEIRRDDNAPTVPLAALVRYAGVIKIFLVEKGRAREVLVTPGVQTTDWAEIAQPRLPSGAVVVTSGQFALANETPISVRPSGPVPTSETVAAEPAATDERQHE
ncbi:efflux RND transporter periplasmic adaptor subunit [Planctomicrobium sp. SH664]|uniref:efflux RND transporter periplasmic adaptor subunit n=1 Tax=Planctomicrobium sp. SH664 TaxID=3448125 RepID=UPI003F5C29B3